MQVVLNNRVVALITNYQGYKEVVFTGIKGYNTKVSMQLSSNVVITKAQLELLAKAVV